MSSYPDAEYGFNRLICFLFMIFGVALVAMMIFLAITASDQMFVEGLVPGWLFGSFGAGIFSVMSVLWGRRLAHTGPRLVLTEAGITSRSFVGRIGWDEIASVSLAQYGSVALHLRDAEAFLDRQSFKFRLLSWHPSSRRRETVHVGGIDLKPDRDDLFADIQARLDQVRLESLTNARIESPLDQTERE